MTDQRLKWFQLWKLNPEEELSPFSSCRCPPQLLFILPFWCLFPVPVSTTSSIELQPLGAWLLKPAWNQSMETYFIHIFFLGFHFKFARVPETFYYVKLVLIKWLVNIQRSAPHKSRSPSHCRASLWFAHINHQNTVFLCLYFSDFIVCSANNKNKVKPFSNSH